MKPGDTVVVWSVVVHTLLSIVQFQFKTFISCHVECMNSFNI